ncbi:MAG TPA: hypothetical protein VGJ06_19310 [Candidatus Acidoferrum sp.]|jgi:DNA-binding NarL/FixJ family response regulator
MATRGQMKSVEFKQARLAPTTENALAEASSAVASASVGSAMAVLKISSAVQPVLAASARSATSSEMSQRSHPAPSPIATAVGKSALGLPRFTAEETILLRGLASGASSKEMATQMRLPRESLYRLIGDLRRKTGASSDTALAVWVLRNMGSNTGERGGGGR